MMIRRSARLTIACFMVLAASPVLESSQPADRAAEREAFVGSVNDMSAEVRAVALRFNAEPANPEVAARRERNAEIFHAMEAMSYSTRGFRMEDFHRSRHVRRNGLHSNGAPVAGPLDYPDAEFRYRRLVEAFERFGFSDAERAQVKEWMLELAADRIADLEWSPGDFVSHTANSRRLLLGLGTHLTSVLHDADERFTLCREIAAMRLAEGGRMTGNEAVDWFRIFGGGAVAAEALLPMLELVELDDAEYASAGLNLIVGPLARIARDAEASTGEPIPGLVEALDRLTAGVKSIDTTSECSWRVVGFSTPLLLRARVDAGLMPAEEAVAIANAWFADPTLWEPEEQDALRMSILAWLRDSPRAEYGQIRYAIRQASNADEARAAAAHVLPIIVEDLTHTASTPAWFEVQRPSSSSAGE